MLLRRILIIAFTLALSAIGSRDAALAYWRGQPAPGVPRALAGDPLLRLRAAEAEFARPELTARNAAFIRREARRVLSASPLHAPALRQLAIAEALGRPAQRDRLMRLAERISRRDGLTQLGLIDLSSRTGNVSEALAHYDRALSVHPELGEQLFPVMARALGDSDIRDGLVPLAPRPWFRGLLGFAADREADAVMMTVFLGQLRGRLPQRDLQAVSARFLARLVASHDYAAARTLLGQMPGQAGSALGQIGFAGATLDPGFLPLSWRLGGDEALEVEAVQGGLAVQVAPERAVLAAQRVTLLAPGAYTLGGRLVYDPAAPRARLAWRISCEGSGRALLEAALPAPEPRSGHALGFTVPDGCAAQRWELHAQGEVAQLAARVRLLDLSLR